MDISLLLGLLAMFGSIVAMIILEGSSVSSVLLIAPIILVFGCTIFAGLAGSVLKDSISHFGSIPRLFVGKFGKPVDTIERMVDLSAKAKKERLKSLENEIGNNGADTFLDEALTSIAMGLEPDELRDALEEKAHTLRTGEMATSNFFSQLGGYAPTMGIIGTVVSLVHVLENLSQPDELGHMIAAAFVATFWGLASANLIWHPFASRAKRLSDLGALNRTLVLEGAVAILDGDGPLVVRTRLAAMVPASLLPKKKKDGGK